MAIQIRKNLQASPNPTSLPKRVEFTQTLISNRDNQAITVVYRLDPAHDVWFQDAGGNPTKSVERTDTISRVEKVCVDRIVMQRGPGQGPLTLVEVNQTITDPSGITLGDVSVVRLEP
jgi:hypothetical protein